MKIAWITVNYQQDEYLADWAGSVPPSSSVCTNDVFVVDNSGVPDRLNLNRPATLLYPGENLGYFGGFNHCLDSIKPLDYDMVICSNPDIVFAPDFLSELQAVAADGPMPMVGAPRITTTDGVEQNPNAANKISGVKKAYYSALFSCYPAFLLLSKARRILRDLPKKASRRPLPPPLPRAIYLPHGACFILSQDFFSAHTRLDDSVFLWGEEALLRKQVHDVGGEIWFLPQLRVVHREHSSTGNIPSRQRFKLMRQSYRIYRTCL